jgi:hypothetical protein
MARGARRKRRRPCFGASPVMAWRRRAQRGEAERSHSGYGIHSPPLTSSVAPVIARA